MNHRYSINPRTFAVARQLLNLTQSDVARSIGITTTNYGKIERSISDPKLSTFTSIVDFFESRNLIFHPDGNITKSKSENNNNI